MLQQQITGSKFVTFDIEADGLLDTITRVHCLVLKPYGQPAKRYRNNAYEDTIRDGIAALQEADYIAGHNIIDFDIAAIKKVYGIDLTAKTVDTLVLSRLAYPTRREDDYAWRPRDMPEELYGAHKLEAWGYRLGTRKGTYGSEESAWAAWNAPMEDYCEQDVILTEKLVEHFAKVALPDAAVEVETELQKIISAQQRHGFRLDIQKAQELNAHLQERRSVLLTELQEQFPPKPAVCLGVYGNQLKRAERILNKHGLSIEQAIENRPLLEAEGIKFRWQPEQPFNPNSENQVIERAQGLGWTPVEFTAKGQAKLDEPILLDLASRFPQTKPLVEFAVIGKRLGQLSEGAAAWLKKVAADGHVHGYCNTMGAITHRFTHSNPNMGQVPSLKKKKGRPVPYGRECRELFTVSPGNVLVGVDASGLELRLLAHYLSRWDGGAYVDAVLNGDIHTKNQNAAQLVSRDQAKTFIYAFIYGAGDTKLGSIAMPDEGDLTVLKRRGKKLRRDFTAKTRGLNELITLVRQKATTQKKLIAVDGRSLKVRQVHSALNTLLQSAGAIAVKRATVRFRDLLHEQGLMMERDWCLVAHVHDEWQTECSQEIAENVRNTAIQSIRLAGTDLNLRCPLDGEARIGRNWAETH